MIAPAMSVAVIVSPLSVTPPMCHSMCSPGVMFMAWVAWLSHVTILRRRAASCGRSQAAEDRHGRADQHEDLEHGQTGEDAEAVGVVEQRRSRWRTG